MPKYEKKVLSNKKKSPLKKLQTQKVNFLTVKKPPVNPNTHTTLLEHISLKITRGIGTPTSIIIHTIAFILSFFVYFLGVDFDTILLFLTTVVSLEAIYLALFIQMSVNRQAESLEDFGEDLEDIQEDVKGLEEDVDEISEDLEDIQEEDKKDEALEAQTKVSLKNIEEDMDKLLTDIESLKKNINTTNLTKKYLNG